MKNVFKNKPKMEDGIPKTLPEADKAIAIEEKNKRDFLRAYDEFAVKLYRFCFFRVGIKELAEDLVSQTFLQTLQYLQNGNEIKSYPVFLYQALKNLITDHWRSKHRRNVSLEEFPNDIFADDRQSPDKIINKIEFKRILDGLNKLPEDQREIIHWRFVDGLSIKEIGALSGKKTGAVYVSIYRAVQRLKKNFDNV